MAHPQPGRVVFYTSRYAWVCVPEKACKRLAKDHYQKNQDPAASEALTGIEWRIINNARPARPGPFDGIFLFFPPPQFLFSFSYSWCFLFFLFLAEWPRPPPEKFGRKSGSFLCKPLLPSFFRDYYSWFNGGKVARPPIWSMKYHST